MSKSKWTNNTKEKADGGNEVRYYHWEEGRLYFKTIGQTVYTYDSITRDYVENGFRSTTEFVKNFAERITVLSPKKIKLLGISL